MNRPLMQSSYGVTIGSMLGKEKMTELRKSVLRPKKNKSKK